MSSAAGEAQRERTGGLGRPQQCQGTARLGREEEQCARPMAQAARLSGRFWCRAGKPCSVPCPALLGALPGPRHGRQPYPLFPFPVNGARLARALP